MESNDDISRKGNIVCILKVLEKYSSESNPLKQSDIIEYVEKDFNVLCERKAIGRNVAVLVKLGYPIVSTKQGSYISKEYSDSEIRFLLDSINSNKYFNDKQTNDLSNKIKDLTSNNFKYDFKHVFNEPNYHNKINNNFLYNVNLIQDAITSNLQIQFDYKIFNEKKELIVSNSKLIVSPYSLVINDQIYYLIGRINGKKTIDMFRLDKLSALRIHTTPAKPISDVNDFSSGLNEKCFYNTTSNIFIEKESNIILNCKKSVLDCIINDFDKSIEKIDQIDSNNYTVFVNYGINAAFNMLLKYSDNVKVTAPTSLITLFKKYSMNLMNSYLK